MWDSNTPLQLLKSMPKVLEKEHLEKLQNLIAADKYKNNLISGFDLCEQGQYAPFCGGCDKYSEYSCAVAYVNYMKAQGMEIDVSSEISGATNENVVGDTEEYPTENINDVKENTRIRIAIARKKTLL